MSGLRNDVQSEDEESKKVDDKGGDVKVAVIAKQVPLTSIDEHVLDVFVNEEVFKDVERVLHYGFNGGIAEMGYRVEERI